MARSLTGTTRTSGQLTQVRRGMAGGKKWLRAGILLALTLACSACDTVNSVTNSVFGPSNAPAQGQPGFVQGFLGGVVADEPRAVLAAREVLSAGGNAADAAVTLGFVLSVTLPSRAALGGGGACLTYSADKKSANQGVPEAVLFTPVAAASLGANADRPAAVPMLARGLYLLHARSGHLPFEGLIVPAEQLARFGTPASRALVRDIALVAGPLLADPNARAVFSQNGTPLAEGQTLLQADLAATLVRIRVSGVGDLYTGALARRIVEASPLAGGPLALADLSAALPRLAPAIVLPERRDKVAFLPPPADGGLAAAAAFSALQRGSTAWSRRRAGARRGGALAAGRCRCREPAAGIGAAAGGGAASPARLHQLRHARQGWQRRRLLAEHGQPVRHRARAAGSWYSARRIAGRGSTAAVFGGDRLERKHPLLPRRGRRLRTGGSADGGGDRHAECAAHQSADGDSGSRPGPRQCHHLHQLSPGR